MRGHKLLVGDYIQKAKRLGCTDKVILENIKTVEEARTQGIKINYEMFLLENMNQVKDENKK